MNLEKAEQFAIEKMKQYNLLPKWQFKFDRATVRFGQCQHTRRVISISKGLVEANEFEEVKDVILHEIAHALVGSRQGHNHNWKNMAKELGCNAQTYYGAEVTACTSGTIWIATCPECGKETERRRRNRTRACRMCCNKYAGGLYDSTYRFNWRKK